MNAAQLQALIGNAMIGTFAPGINAVTPLGINVQLLDFNIVEPAGITIDTARRRRVEWSIFQYQ